LRISRRKRISFACDGRQGESTILSVNASQRSDKDLNQKKGSCSEIPVFVDISDLSINWVIFYDNVFFVDQKSRFLLVQIVEKNKKWFEIQHVAD
jgi:hypothetical protein